jgi:hypothetical protein
MVTPVRVDSPANTLRAVPSALLSRAGLLFVDGDPKPTPIFPIELLPKTTPDALNLSVTGLCLSLRPTTKVVGFRLIHVTTSVGSIDALCLCAMGQGDILLRRANHPMATYYDEVDDTADKPEGSPENTKPIIRIQKESH